MNEESSLCPPTLFSAASAMMQSPPTALSRPSPGSLYDLTSPIGPRRLLSPHRTESLMINRSRSPFQTEKRSTFSNSDRSPLQNGSKSPTIKRSLSPFQRHLTSPISHMERPISLGSVVSYDKPEPFFKIYNDNVSNHKGLRSPDFQRTSLQSRSPTEPYQSGLFSYLNSKKNYYSPTQKQNSEIYHIAQLTKKSKFDFSRSRSPTLHSKPQYISHRQVNDSDYDKSQFNHRFGSEYGNKQSDARTESDIAKHEKQLSFSSQFEQQKYKPYPRNRSPETEPLPNTSPVPYDYSLLCKQTEIRKDLKAMPYSSPIAQQWLSARDSRLDDHTSPNIKSLSKPLHSGIADSSPPPLQRSSAPPIYHQRSSSSPDLTSSPAPSRSTGPVLLRCRSKEASVSPPTLHRALAPDIVNSDDSTPRENTPEPLSQKPSPVPIHADFKIKSDDRSTEFLNVFDKSTPLQITIPPPNLASIPTLLSPPSSCEASKPLSGEQAGDLGGKGDSLLKSNPSIAG